MRLGWVSSASQNGVDGGPSQQTPPSDKPLIAALRVSGVARNCAFSPVFWSTLLEKQKKKETEEKQGTNSGAADGNVYALVDGYVEDEGEDLSWRWGMPTAAALTIRSDAAGAECPLPL